MSYRQFGIVTGMALALWAGAADAVFKTLKVDGLMRSYRLYVPATQPAAGPTPLVLVLHGGFGSGDRMETFTRGGFNRLAERDGWLVAYPDGIERHWNDGRSGVRYRTHRQNIDDVGFLVALIDELAAKHRADPKRVFVTGASNGAMMSHRLAFEQPERLAGMAPLIGSIPEALQTTQLPRGQVPALIVNGTLDPLVPWAGGEIRSFGRPIGSVVSVEKTVRIWCEVNRCLTPPTVEQLPDADPNDGCTVTRSTYSPEAGGAPVVLVTVTGGGHTWPGGTQYLDRRFIGRVCKDFDACEMIWEFFRGLTVTPPAPTPTEAAPAAAEDPAGPNQ